MRTFMAKATDVERKWYVVDAQNKALGRVASEIARILRGKHKPIFTPHVDTGDFVIVINAKKILLTGNKAEQKFYYRHSGYPGGIKGISYGELLKKDPRKVMELAVKGMLPHTKLGRAMFKKMKVYPGSQHPHAAQMPENWQASS